jgi:hypothetical protein
VLPIRWNRIVKAVEHALLDAFERRFPSIDREGCALRDYYDTYEDNQPEQHSHGS